MINNQLSKAILRILRDSPTGSLKFHPLAEMLGVDKRSVAKNLFFLEEKGFVEVRSVYNPGTLFPDIYYVILNRTGVKVAGDEDALEAYFPDGNDHYMGNIDSVFEQVVGPMKMWAAGDSGKTVLMHEYERMIHSDLFRQFIEDIYARHRSK